MLTKAARSDSDSLAASLQTPPAASVAPCSIWVLLSPLGEQLYTICFTLLLWWCRSGASAKYDTECVNRSGDMYPTTRGAELSHAESAAGESLASSAASSAGEPSAELAAKSAAESASRSAQLLPCCPPPS